MHVNAFEQNKNSTNMAVEKLFFITKKGCLRFAAPPFN